MTCGASRPLLEQRAQLPQQRVGLGVSRELWSPPTLHGSGGGQAEERGGRHERDEEGGSSPRRCRRRRRRIRLERLVVGRGLNRDVGGGAWHGIN